MHRKDRIRRNRELVDAAGDGASQRVLSLLRDGAKVDHKDDNGATALHHAAANGRLECVRILVEAGSDVNGGSSQSPVLLAAAGNGQGEVLEYLLSIPGTELDRQDSSGATALHAAAARGEVEVMKLLIARGSDVNHRSSSTHCLRSTLVTAVAYEQPAAVQLLCSLPQLQPGVPDSKKMTPLHHAVLKRNRWILEMLIMMCSPQDVEIRGHRPVELAVYTGWFDGFVRLYQHAPVASGRQLTEVAKQGKRDSSRLVIEGFEWGGKDEYARIVSWIGSNALY
jgi:uncharacterized protein